MGFKFLSHIVIVTWTLSWTTGLEWVPAVARLPFGLSMHSAVYDGDDTIYTVGGSGFEADYNHILRYTLSDGLVSIHGYFIKSVQGAALLTPDGHIYNVGGRYAVNNYSSDISRYSLDTGDWERVHGLPGGIALASSGGAWDARAGNLYLFGGATRGGFPPSYTDKILQYTPATNEIQDIANLPAGPRAGSSAVVNGAGDRIYLLYGANATEGLEAEARREIFEFEPSTKTVTRLPGLFPVPIWEACSVWANGSVYTFDGELYRFSPSAGGDGEVRRIGLSDVSGGDGGPIMLVRAACVYVPKLNRIYTIGGWGQLTATESGYSHRNEVCYIQLGGDESPPPPTTTTTEPPQPSTTPNSAWRAISGGGVSFIQIFMLLITKSMFQR